MKKVLLSLWMAGCLLGYNQTDSGARADRGLKDEHIRHQLTAMLSDVSLHARSPGAMQEMLANMDALIGVESSKCNTAQYSLLRHARKDLQTIEDTWSEYAIHAGQSHDPDEERKAEKAAADCVTAIDKAKRTLSEAAASF